MTVTILLFTSFRYFVHECYASKWMKSTAMIRSLLDPVCRIKVRVITFGNLVSDTVVCLPSKPY